MFSPPPTSSSRSLERSGGGGVGCGEKDMGGSVEQQLWVSTKTQVLDLLQRTAVDQSSTGSLLTHEVCDICAL